MKKSYKLSLAAIAVSISLVGCGSDSDSTSAVEKVTGQFVDTYVSGLNYTCSSGTTGITNTMGEYTCNVGDTVEFSLGGYLLGSVTASSGIVTPEALYPDNPEAALNVAQVIQSLDADPTDDIITIPDNFTDLDDVTTTPEDENFDALIEDVLDVPLVTEEEAQEHLDETELMLLLAGKTFYNVDVEWIDKFVFNADLTSGTWTQIEGSDIGSTDTDTLRVEGEKLYVNEEFYAVIAEETDDYILINDFNLDGSADGESRLYFDQAKAEAYYDSLQPIPMTTEMLSGKVFYTDGGNDFEQILFISSSEVIFREILLGQDGSIMVDTGTDALPYIINSSGEVVIQFSDGGTNTYQLLSMTDTQWNMTKNGDADSAYSTWLLDPPSNFPTLESLIVGQTKYFATSTGLTGVRNYATDGTYTASLTPPVGDTFATSGTYEIVGNVLTINRILPAEAILVLTYLDAEAGGLSFDGTLNAGEVFQAISFATAGERDAFVASLP